MDRQRVRQAAVLAGVVLPLMAGAALLRPVPPKAFDFNEFEREQALARTFAERSTRHEAREAQVSTQVKDLDKRINGAVVVYGAVEGSRR